MIYQTFGCLNWELYVKYKIELILIDVLLFFQQDILLIFSYLSNLGKKVSKKIIFFGTI